MTIVTDEKWVGGSIPYDGPGWSILEIILILELSCFADFGEFSANLDSKIFIPTVNKLVHLGIVEPYAISDLRDGIADAVDNSIDGATSVPIFLTHRGRLFVEMLKEVPMPKQIWVNPTTGAIIKDAE